MATQKIGLIATGGGRYRVVHAGEEVSPHTQYHTAIAAAIAVKQENPDALVEVVTDFRVRVEIARGATCPEPVEPEPVEPEPVEPEPVEPEPPIADASLLHAEAATMEPGEWRNLASKTTWPDKEEGRSFKSFQSVSGTASNGSGSADGMGWTQRVVLHNGRLMMLLMRDNAPVSLIGMEPDGAWWRKDSLDGGVTGWHGSGWSELSGGRRPFNRLTHDGTYLYFSASAGLDKPDIGRLQRTPLAAPGAFEFAPFPGYGSTSIDSVGNHAVLWVEEWGRFYSYAQGGAIRSIAPGEDTWTFHGQTPYYDGSRASGYAGELVYNPVKDELVCIGGQHFGSPPGTSTKWVRMRGPFADVEALPDLPVVDGQQLSYTAAQGKLLVDPRDGGYILQVGRERMYRTATAEGAWETYLDLYEDAGRPFGNYESYAPVALIPGTDVFVFVSHIRGVVLHRLRALGETA